MKGSLSFLGVASMIFLCSLLSTSGAEDRKTKVLSDRAEVQAAGKWIYNDLPKGLAVARSTGKPMLVVLRCLP